MRRHPGPHAGQGRLRRRPARLRRDRPPQGQQAADRPLRARPACRRAATWSSSAPPTPRPTPSARRSRSSMFEAGALVDVVATSKGKGFAGVMKRHGFNGPGRRSRRAAQAPLARLHRRLRHPGSRVQGHEDGRPHGRRAHHDPEPQGPRGRRRAGRAPDQGRDPRPDRRPRPRPQRRQGRLPRGGAA